ncbi:hypothetical protein GCK32_013889 [Trichostrongylus colubriformis]|uniref:Uncharacterized protein n=1 Tax=Trichostrongylus colubriformis TaxID=6319 RepID=A0AAN8IXP6_TRICO
MNSALYGVLRVHILRNELPAWQTKQISNLNRSHRRNQHSSRINMPVFHRGGKILPRILFNDDHGYYLD